MRTQYNHSRPGRQYMFNYNRHKLKCQDQPQTDEAFIGFYYRHIDKNNLNIKIFPKLIGP